MLKAILFDLDNTLIDFIRMKRKASNAAAKAMVRTGLKMDVKLAEKKLFDTYIKDIEGEHAFQDFLKAHNAYDDRRLAAALNAYLTVKYTYLWPYPGVKRTLKKLKQKGLKIGIVTDAPRIKAFQRLDAMGIADYFDVVVGFEDTNEHKPSKEPFQEALRQLKLKPEEVIYVGDWPERDILGAKSVGMKTCLVKYGKNTLGQKVKADFQIGKVSQLMKLI